MSVGPQRRGPTDPKPPGRRSEEQVPVPRQRARSIAPLVGRTTLRSRAVEPDEQTVPSAHGGGSTGALSYSVRVCGHCRKPAEPDGKGGMRCPSCGRTRGWL